MKKQDFVDKHPGLAFLICVLLVILLMITTYCYVRLGIPMIFLRDY